MWCRFQSGSKMSVGEAEGEQVLHRLLAQVMVDAEDLLLPPVREQRAVQLDRRGEVASEGLLDDQAPPALRMGMQARGRKFPADHPEHGRRRGEIEEGVAAGFVPGTQEVEALAHLAVGRVVLETAGDVVQPTGEVLPDGCIEVIARCEAADRGVHALPELRRGHRLARHADDRDARGEQSVAGQVVERGDQQPPHHVAGGAEDDEDAGISLGRGHFFTACPPNWLRNAAITFIVGASAWREAKRA